MQYPSKIPDSPILQTPFSGRHDRGHLMLEVLMTVLQAGALKTGLLLQKLPTMDKKERAFH